MESQTAIPIQHSFSLDVAKTHSRPMKRTVPMLQNMQDSVNNCSGVGDVKPMTTILEQRYNNGKMTR